MPETRRSRVALLAGALIAAAALAIAASRGRGDTSHRVVVAAFENRSGDRALDPLGRVAADWVTRGLATLDGVEVVEPLVAPASEPRRVGRETGAGLVVVGAYFRQGDSVGIEARVVDAAMGRVRRTIEPSFAPADAPLAAVDAVRDHVAASLASELDARIVALVHESDQPPTYEAYQAWVTGLDLFARRDYYAAIPLFRRAAALDTGFLTPRLWIAAAYGNAGEYSPTDSIVASLDSLRERLTPLDRAFLDFWRANLRGDLVSRYDATGRMLDAAPASELALYARGVGALDVRRYDEAIGVLRRIPVDTSRITWDLYGTALATALHMARRYDEELAEARRRHARQPMWLAAIADEARALAASDDVAQVDRLLAQAATIPGQPRWTAGDVLLETANELEVHGHAREARAACVRAAEWIRAQPTASRQTSASRSLLARTAYCLEQWDAADSLFRTLSAERPTSVAYLGSIGAIAAHRGDVRGAERVVSALAELRPPYDHGASTAWRADIAAVLGRRDEAVRLLRAAFAEGVHPRTQHANPDLMRLYGYAPYESLVAGTQ